MDGCVPGGRSAGFSRIVLLIEACDSGSMLDGMRLPEGVYAVTATRPGEKGGHSPEAWMSEESSMKEAIVSLEARGSFQSRCIVRA